MGIAAATGLLFLAAALFFGGWYWALMGAAALAVLWGIEFTPTSVMLMIGVSLFWLALFHWTGDRRLFFPYSIQFAAQTACLLPGRRGRAALLGGGGMVALFTAIRLVQAATLPVLTVELLVSAVVLAISASFYRLRVLGQGTELRCATGAVASVLAFAGLAF